MTWLLAALWPLIWHFGIGASLIAAALAVAFLTTFRKTALIAAAAIAVAMVAYGIGAVDGKRYMQARWDAAEALAKAEARR